MNSNFCFLSSSLSQLEYLFITFAFSQAMIFLRSYIYSSQISLSLYAIYLFFSCFSLFSRLIYSAYKNEYLVMIKRLSNSKYPRNFFTFSSVKNEFLISVIIYLSVHILSIMAIRFSLNKFNRLLDFENQDSSIVFFFSSSRIYCSSSIFNSLFLVSQVAPWFLCVSIFCF